MIHRRTLLQWGAAAPLLIAQPGFSVAQSTVPQNTIVIIDAVDATTDTTRLALVLGAFFQVGLPVTCLVDAAGLTGAALRPEMAIAGLLRSHRENLPGLFEIAPIVPDLGLLTPYFQARAAFQAKATLDQNLWAEADVPLSTRRVQSVACDHEDDPLAPSGLRAAGVRNILMRPNVSTKVRPEHWQDGVVRMIGGVRTQLSDKGRNFAALPTSEVERVFYLTARDFDDFPKTQIKDAAAQFATQVQQEKRGLWASPILASDIQFRDFYGYERNVALHFFLNPTASQNDREVLSNFRADLIDAGLPSSIGFAAPNNPLASVAYWVNVDGDLGADVPNLPLPGYIAGRPETPLQLGSATTVYGMSVRLTDIALGGQAGLDADSSLIVPTAVIRSPDQIDALSTLPAGSNDFTLAVPFDTVRHQSIRGLLKKQLISLSNDGISSVRSLPDYVRTIVPTGPYISHYRRTQTNQFRVQPVPFTKPDNRREQLLEDARVAWRYFERWTNKTTGLCPATVEISTQNRELHEAVTMWDVGSHIFALIAAADLGFISEKQFRRSIAKIMANIPGRRSQGRLLPQGWIATNRFKWGVKDFDGCDAGRLLSALYSLAVHPFSDGQAEKTVTAYDLEDIVQGGVIYSVQGGKLETSYRSHCAHYAAWAFRTWGMEVISPYEVFAGKSESDGKMALLEVAGHIGPLGAEPLLLEALELGMSRESAYLADVLFAAQYEEFLETGMFTCVSEGPIDRAPWFLYQGLQFDAPNRVWATDTVESLPEHRSKAFREKNSVVSSKAAYLWAAYKEHPYCDQLVEFVRGKARTTDGFASSIYRLTGNETTAYTDINTNAVILQSVANMLKENETEASQRE